MYLFSGDISQQRKAISENGSGQPLQNFSLKAVTFRPKSELRGK